MKKVILIVLGVATGLVWVCLCFGLVGLIAYDGTTAGDNAITVSSDAAYLSCSAQVQSDSAGLVQDIADSIRTLEPNGGGFAAACWQPSWMDRALELQVAHADCPMPSDRRLQEMHHLIDQSLAEYVLAVEYQRDYCTTSQDGLLTLAAEHMANGFWYMNQAHDLLEKYRSQTPEP